MLSIMVMQGIAPAAGSAGRSARPAADSPAAITARLRSRSTFIGAAADKAFMWYCCTASEVTFSNTNRLAQRSIRPAGRSSSWVGDQQVRPVAAETGDGDPAQLAFLSPEPALSSRMRGVLYLGPTLDRLILVQPTASRPSGQPRLA